MLRSSEDDDRLRRENKVEQEVESEQAKPPQRPKLENFVPRDQDMYEAMEFFLLASPKRQVLQDGSSTALKRQADEARQAGNNIVARISYESAAKLALYEQNRDMVKELLELADDVTKVERFKDYHHILLRNLDQAMRIAREYYAAFKEEGETSTKPTTSAPLNEPARAGGSSVMAPSSNSRI